MKDDIGEPLLRPKDVLEIAELISQRIPYAEIGKKYGIHKTTVAGIANKHSWAWLTKNRQFPVRRKSLNETQKDEVLCMLSEGQSQQKIADFFEVSQGYISMISRGLS